MIPISDNILNWKKPIISYWLIGLNIGLFLWELRLEFTGELYRFVHTWGIVPEQTNLAITNALFYNPAAFIIVFGRLLALPVSLFLHSSFSQIISNIIFLWVFGKTIENILGQKQYLILYLAAGIFAGMVQIFLDPNLKVPIVGANCAIASILGAYIIRFPQARIDSIIPLIIVYIPVELPAFFYLFWWFVQQAFHSIGALNIPGGINQFGLNFWGQMAGLATGAAFMRIIQRR
ncbi:MAG TPA: rhomboid family intramembrane serine protease [Nostocaceae cyanobacterium]|nr:rhomboid family intramembrane serine protease [Nostocaceae cyanobacterium]